LASKSNNVASAHIHKRQVYGTPKGVQNLRRLENYKHPTPPE